MTQFYLSGMVWNVPQRCGRAAASSAEAAGADLHRRGGRGEAAAVPQSLSPPVSKQGGVNRL